MPAVPQRGADPVNRAVQAEAFQQERELITENLEDAIYVVSRLGIKIEHDAAQIIGHFLHHGQRHDADQNLRFQRNPVEQLSKPGVAHLAAGKVQRA